MKNKNNFFDRFFHFVAALVDLYTLVQICQSAYYDQSWGFKEWLSLGLAVSVTFFVIIYRWMKGKRDGDDNDDESLGPNQSMIFFIGQYNNKCNISKQHNEFVTI